MSLKPIFWIILFAGMVVVAVYGLYRQFSIQADRLPQIMQQLVVPYVALVAQEQYPQAYTQYTSRHFQDQHSLEDYRAAQHENRQKYGLLQTIETTTGGLDEIMEIGRKTFYRGRFKYIGTKDFTYITMDIVHEKNRYKIDQMYDQRNLNALF